MSKLSVPKEVYPTGFLRERFEKESYNIVLGYQRDRRSLPPDIIDSNSLLESQMLKTFILLGNNSTRSLAATQSIIKESTWATGLIQKARCNHSASLLFVCVQKIF